MQERRNKIKCKNKNKNLKSQRMKINYQMKMLNSECDGVKLLVGGGWGGGSGRAGGHSGHSLV